MNRRSASFKDLVGDDIANLPVSKAIDLMLRDPNLIKRPLVIRGRKVAFGYDAAGLEEIARA